MKGERGFLIAIVLVVAAAVIWGLWQTGGPGAGREARLDQRRIHDLRQISGLLSCPGGAVGDLPETLTHDALARRCPRGDLSDLALTDPEDGQPYRYSREGRAFSICARFADASRIARPQIAVPRAGVEETWDAATGCLTASPSNR